MVAKEQQDAATGSAAAPSPALQGLKRPATGEPAAVTEGDVKQRRTGDDAAAGARVVLNPELLSEASRAQLKSQYLQAEPYLHCVMQQPFQRELLESVRDEIINNIQATYKETDLFKVFQTGDLGNLARLDQETAAKLPALMALKDALYSHDFRAFIREVTGCGELADKTDCSCNVYAKGGHLLCHDDVIGTRRVSWIIYLTDPEDPWTDKDGGALELYPLEQGQKHTPTVHPTVQHLPVFNTMAMFTVMPGKSFHSVQEVLVDDKPRMSISGWYHAPTEPEDMDKASLQQLQAPTAAAAPSGKEQQGAVPEGLAAGQDNATAALFTPFPSTVPPSASGASGEAEEALSEDDLAFLIRYINPAYLSEASWPKIQAKFKEEGSVQLQNFLSKSWASRIQAATQAADKAESLGSNALPAYTAGLAGGWEAVGPPHKQRYVRYAGSTAPEVGAHAEGVPAKCKEAGEVMNQVREQLFQSAPFQRLIKAFTTLHMVGHHGEVRRFRPGLDYTVAHFGILTKDPRMDVVLTFVDDQGAAQSKDTSPWDDGEVGGFEAYLLAEDDKQGDAAAEEVYRVGTDAEESGVLNVSAAPNTLNLVLRDEGLMKFVKYVSAAAPGSRWDVCMEYLPEDDSDDDDDEEAAAGGGKEEGKAGPSSA